MSKIKCPLDGGDLLVSTGDPSDERLRDADLSCSQCAAIYRIRDGILDILKNGSKVSEGMKQEIEARDEDADRYDDITDLPWYRLEIPRTLAHLADTRGKEIVEFGSGTGRITVKMVKRAKSIIAVDFSRSSLLVLAGRLSESNNIGLILGDVTRMRFAPAAFDIAISTQVLEHIPTKKLRSDFLSVVKTCIDPDGYFLCTAYYHDLRRRIRRHPKEGFHESGIFFHYFDKEELIDAFSDHFEIKHIHPFLSHVPKIWRLQLKFPGLVNLFEKAPIFREFGSLILIKSVKKTDSN